MFEMSAPIWEVILRAAVVYLVLIIVLRVMGKKELGQMSPPDLLLLLLIAHAAEGSLIGEEHSLQGGLIAVVTLVVLNYGVGELQRRIPALRRTMENSPTVIIWNGQIMQEAMSKERMSRETLFAALREEGQIDEKGVRLAVLEKDGRLSVITHDGAAQGEGPEGGASHPTTPGSR